MASVGTERFGRRKMVFFTDSRGYYINELIKEEYGDNKGVEILFYEGAGIGTLVKNAYYYAESRPHDMIFIAGGICNITRKDPVSKKLFFDWNNSIDLAKHIIDIMDEEEDVFNKKAPATKMVFCNLLGADLSRALKQDAEVQQIILNEAIYLINEDIFQKNIVKKLFAPDLASPVHRQINGKNTTFLKHLSSDGIHLTRELKKKWARKMYSTSSKYLI